MYDAAPVETSKIPHFGFQGLQVQPLKTESKAVFKFAFFNNFSLSLSLSLSIVNYNFSLFRSTRFTEKYENTYTVCPKSFRTFIKTHRKEIIINFYL